MAPADNTQRSIPKFDDVDVADWRDGAFDPPPTKLAGGTPLPVFEDDDWPEGRHAHTLIGVVPRAVRATAKAGEITERFTPVNDPVWPEEATTIFLDTELVIEMEAQPPPVDATPDPLVDWAVDSPEAQFFAESPPEVAIAAEPPPLPEPELEPVPEPVAEVEPRLGQVITVFGCRGGCGATTIAVNLAGALAAAGKDVCIVDLDVQLGDVLVTLDLEAAGTASLVNLTREAAALDPSVLKRRLVRHAASGAYVVSQAGRLEELDDTLPAKIPELLSILARTFDAVIIDGIDDFSELALAAIDAADVVALVVTQDVLAVRRARRVVDVCRQLEIGSDKLCAVLNRYRRGNKIDIDGVAGGLSTPVAATIVDDERTTTYAQTVGGMLHEVARGKRITRDLSALYGLVANRRREMVR